MEWLRDSIYGYGFGSSRGSGFVKYGDSTISIYYIWSESLLVVETKHYDKRMFVDVIVKPNSAPSCTLKNGFEYRRLPNR